MGKEGPKDRLETDLRAPTWAKEAPKINRDGCKKGALGKECPKDRLEMVSREPTYAQKG